MTRDYTVAQIAVAFKTTSRRFTGRSIPPASARVDVGSRRLIRIDDGFATDWRGPGYNSQVRRLVGC